MMTKTAFAFVLVALLLPLAARAADGPGALEPRIEGLVRPYVDGGILVGGVIGVVENGRETRVPFGWVSRDASAPAAPTSETVFEIGSISKAFTGTILALLVNDGRARLDQPLQDLLPAEAVTIPVAGERPITLADVATHTSGLPRMPSNFAPKDPSNPYADYTVEQMYAFVGSCRPARPPGGAYEYSNLAMGLLGHALARKAGSSYEDLLVASIASPLGMTSTRIALTGDMRKRLAPGHDAALSPAANWDIPTLAGAGGIRSTASDMMRFLRANLAAGEATPLAKAMALAQRTHWADPTGRMEMGLGWHIRVPGGWRWHNGQTGGYHSFLAFDREGGRGVVVLSNTASMKVDELGGALIELLEGKDVKPIEAAKEVAVSKEILERYVGKYELAPGLVFDVEVGDGRLEVQLTGQPRFPVFAKSETEFAYRVVDASLAFEIEPGAQKAKALVLHQNGVHRAKRVE